jgi:hypothetical protein
MNSTMMEFKKKPKDLKLDFWNFLTRPKTQKHKMKKMII